MSGEVLKPPRTPWNDFPDVILHQTIARIKGADHYKQAKSGDTLAADKLVRQMIDPNEVARLVSLIGDRRPLLVSVHAIESEGINAIPEALANQLADRLAFGVARGVHQINVVSYGCARL